MPQVTANVYTLTKKLTVNADGRSFDDVQEFRVRKVGDAFAIEVVAAGKKYELSRDAGGAAGPALATAAIKGFVEVSTQPNPVAGQHLNEVQRSIAAAFESPDEQERVQGTDVPAPRSGIGDAFGCTEAAS
jgi:hypothetical protein